MSILGGFLMPHPPIIIHEVGEGREKESIQTIKGMEEAARKIAEIQPQTIVLITPHGPSFTDAIAIYDGDILRGDLSRFNAPEVRYNKKNDTDFLDELEFTCHERNIPVARMDDTLIDRFNLNSELDHGALIPLHFIEQAYSDYRLICISYGILSSEMLYRFGQAIQETAEYMNKSTVVIASGDLSHRLKDDGPYAYHPDGIKFDHLILSLMEEKQVDEVILLDQELCRHAGECGKRSIDIMLGALDGYEFNSRKISYEGPFGVGYGVMQLTELKKNIDYKWLPKIQAGKKKAYTLKKQSEDAYVRLARKAVEAVVKEGKRLSVSELIPEILPKEMVNKRGGTFVSIKSNGGLRGCMGTIGGTQNNIAEEIIENAIKASKEDPRFPEIEEEELEELEITVDVLGKAEVVDDMNQLDPKTYGVIVSKGYKRGLLLPNLEGIDTVADQIRIALNKAGIDLDEKYEVERFKVTRHY